MYENSSRASEGRRLCCDRYATTLLIFAERSLLLMMIDNTNPTIETRSLWVDLARNLELPIRCVLFTADPLLCMHNESVRAQNKAVSSKTQISDGECSLTIHTDEPRRSYLASKDCIHVICKPVPATNAKRRV